VTGLGVVNLGAGFVDLARVFSSRARGDASVPNGPPHA